MKLTIREYECVDRGEVQRNIAKKRHDFDGEFVLRILAAGQ